MASTSSSRKRAHLSSELEIARTDLNADLKRFKEFRTQERLLQMTRNELKQAKAPHDQIEDIERQIVEKRELANLVQDNIAASKEQIASLERSQAAVQERIANLQSVPAASSDDYFKDIQKLGAPSSLCKSVKWRKAQEVHTFLCHIPPEAEPPFPITLVHAAFAGFVDRFNDATIQFGTEECDLVVELCEMLAQDFNSEEEKMQNFNKLVGRYMGKAIAPLYIQNYSSDGSILAGLHMAYTSEGKVDMGNPLFQAMQYYALFLSNMDADKREATFCPAFLVELVGFHMRISGLAFFSKVACEPFTPFMNCHINSYDKTDMDTLCRAMLGLKQGVSDLCHYYNVSANLPTVDKRIPYPLMERQVQFVQRIDEDKLLFVVRMEQSDELRVMKYCRRYGKEVHRTWAEHGLAPKLFDCKSIAGGWFAVEMEYLPGDEWKSVHRCCNSVQEPNKSTLSRAIREALQKATELTWDGKSMAHGDVRAPNIMAKLEDGAFEVKFVDFDWAGEVSSTFYPSFINTEVSWHTDVGPGKPLSQDHDTWWVDKWI